MKTHRSPLPIQTLLSCKTLKLLVSIFILSLEAGSGVSVAAQTLEVLKTPEKIRFKDGFVLRKEPNLNSPVVKTVAGPVNVNIAAHCDTPEVRFFLSDWSYDQHKQGKDCFWMYVPGVGATSGSDKAPKSASTAESEANRLEVLPEPKEITTESGFTLYETPSLKARVVKRVPGPVNVNVAAIFETPEGRFVLSDWSYAQYKQGKPSFWIYAGPTEREKAHEDTERNMIREVSSLLQKMSPATIRAPQGYEVLDAPTPDAKVLKHVEAAETIRVAGYHQDSDCIYFVSDWSVERYNKEKVRPSWIRLLGGEEVAAAASQVVSAIQLEEGLRGSLSDEQVMAREKVYVGRQLLALLESRLSKTAPEAIVTAAQLAELEMEIGNSTAARILARRYVSASLPEKDPELLDTMLLTMYSDPEWVASSLLASTHKILGEYAEADALWQKLDHNEEPGRLAGDPIERAELRLLLGRGVSDPLVQKVEKICISKLATWEQEKLAEIYLRNGHKEDALRFIRAANAQHINDPEANFWQFGRLAAMGRIAILVGDAQEARRAVTLAVEKLPKEDSSIEDDILTLAFVAERLGMDSENKQLLDFVINNTHWRIDLGREHSDIDNLSDAVETGGILQATRTLDTIFQHIFEALTTTSRRIMTREAVGKGDLRAESVTAATFLNCDWAAKARSGKAMATSALAFKGQMGMRRLFEIQLTKAADASPQGKVLVAHFRELEEKWLDSWDSSVHEKLDHEIHECVSKLESLLEMKLSYCLASEVKWKNVQASLPEGAVLVEFARCKDVLYAAAVIPKNGDPLYVEFGEADAINELIQRYRATVTGDDAAASPGSDLEKSFREVNDALYKALISPLEPLLGAGVTDVILSPDDQLHFLNLAGLCGPDGVFWAQKRRIHYVASGRDLLREPSEKALQPKSIFLVGNPDFNNQAPKLAIERMAAPEIPKLMPLIASNLRAVCRDGFDGVLLSDLPGAEEEIRVLHPLFDQRQWAVSTVSPAEAMESCMRDLAAAPEVIHLATHGFYFNDLTLKRNGLLSGGLEGHAMNEVILDPMKRAGLAFAGANTTIELWEKGEIPPAADDGLLTADEVARLSLNGTRLVTLSACETGNGEALSGEGVSGLKIAFRFAGAENLLLTLWPINDAATVEVMKAFYIRVLDGEHFSRALGAVHATLLPELSRKQGLRSAVNLVAPFVLTMGTRFE